MKPRPHHARRALLLVLALAGPQLHAGGLTTLDVSPFSSRLTGVAMNAPGTEEQPAPPAAEAQDPRQPSPPPASSGVDNSSGGGGTPESAPAANATHSMQRSGRLSPEERRALRRQIDEAGHDIYSRKK